MVGRSSPVGFVVIVGPKESGDAVGKKVGQLVFLDDLPFDDLPFDDLPLDLPVLAVGVTFPDLASYVGEKVGKNVGREVGKASSVGFADVVGTKVGGKVVGNAVGYKVGCAVWIPHCRDITIDRNGNKH